MKTLGPETDDLIGGDREEMTRAMFLAGVAWLDAHPSSVPSFVMTPAKRQIAKNSAAAELLYTIIQAAPNPEVVDEACVQTAVNHCSFVRIWGWNEYLTKMRRSKYAPAKCLRTGNPVVTDAWGPAPCDCAVCRGYLEGNRLGR